MKLYYSPGACSLASHIVAIEGKLPVELSRVTFDGATRTTAEGEDFFQVNPKGGYVPALRMDSGDVIAEGVAIMQYFADQSSEQLMPERGTLDYYRALEWLTFINSELHKQFSPLYNPAIAEDAKAAQIDKISSRMTYAEEKLGEHEYLVGDSFTAPDAYFYTIMRWTKRFDISLDAYPNIAAFMARMEARDGVEQALKEEGLDPIAA
jgi:glutathione S-transferase